MTLATVLALVGLAVAVRLYAQYGAGSYDATVLRYGEVTDSHATVTFEVRKPADRTATCRVQAKDAYAAETGYAEVTVGKGADVTVTYTVPTRARAVAVTVLGCNDAAP